MTQLKLRFGNPEDAAQIVNWLNANPNNEFNPEVLKYPTLRIFTAYSESGNEAHLPFQRVLMLESYAPRPGMPLAVSAQALRDFTKAAELIASSEGIREIYFLDGAAGVSELALANGYEEVPFKVYRMRLK